MTAATALTRGRRAAEALMVDTGEVTRPGAATRGTLDENTGRYTGGSQPPFVYTGKCRLQIRGMGSSTTPETGGQPWIVQQTVLQLPVTGSEDVREGDRFLLVTSVHNPGMEGRTYDIARRLSDKTHATKREFLLTEAGVTS